LHPLLKAIMGCRMPTQLGLIQCLPLTAGARRHEKIASAQSRSGTRGRPPPKRCVFTCNGSSGCNLAHNSSEIRNPVVVRLFGVRSRSRCLVACLLMPPILPRFSGYSDRHLVAWLKQHRAEQLKRKSQVKTWEKRDLVFPNLRGGYLHPTHMGEEFRALLEQAELPPSRFHDLRHSAATILLSME